MDNIQQQEQGEGRRTSYVNYDYNVPSIVKIRLDSQLVIKQIELFLKGSREVVKTTETGEVEVYEETFGDPLANNYGIQSIILSLSATLNAQVVQGNYDLFQYGQYVCDKRISLVCSVVSNQTKWGISDENVNWIVDTIMETVEPFMSRLKDNKERESYANYQTSDTIMKDTRSSGMFPNILGGQR